MTYRDMFDKSPCFAGEVVDGESVEYIFRSAKRQLIIEDCDGEIWYHCYERIGKTGQVFDGVVSSSNTIYELLEWIKGSDLQL